MNESKTSNTFILVAEIDPMRVGMPYQAALHCTVMDWFISELTPSQVCDIVQSVVGQIEPFIIESGHQEDFGAPGKPLPVNVVKESTELWALHRALRAALDAQKVTYIHPQYVGDGWRAHVTVQHKTRALPEGQTHWVAALYLIEAKGDINDEDSEKVVQARLAIGQK